MNAIARLKEFNLPEFASLYALQAVFNEYPAPNDVGAENHHDMVCRINANQIDVKTWELSEAAAESVDTVQDLLLAAIGQAESVGEKLIADLVLHLTQPRLKASELKVGHTYEATKARPCTNKSDGVRYVNDRRIIEIVGDNVQYVKPNIFGKKQPKMESVQVFLKWAGRDITDEIVGNEWRLFKKKTR